jgi:hypothetical protein
LFLFTFGESIIVAFCCVASEPKIVSMAAIFTLGITVALTVHAFTTDKDYTGLGGILYAFLISLVICGFFALFTDNNIVHIIICLVGVMLFSVYLIYDT